MRRLVCLALLVVPAGCAPSSRSDSRPLLAYSNGNRIVLYDPATRSRRRLVRGLNPAWSPDGRRIAYVRFGHATRIAVADVRTGKTRWVSHRVGDSVAGYGLRWSPDGRWIVYRDQGARELWVARTDGSSERRVAKVAGREIFRLGSLGWTDAGRVVFRADGRRFAVDPDGGRPEPYGGRFPPPTHSPDGRRRLAVARDRDGNDQIVARTASGLAVGPLTHDRPIAGRLPVRSCCPRWSPDGRWVAFVRAGAVAVVGADGRSERRVLENAAIAGWSPDGRYLLVAGRLGEHSLRLYEPATGRVELVVQAYELDGAAWRPGPAPRFVSVAPRRPLAARTVETPLPTSSFRRGRVRIREIRPFPLPAESALAGISPDGRLAALTLATGRHSARVAVLHLATGAVRWLGVTASPWWDDRPSFDGSGRRLLYRRWHELSSVSLADGRARRLARDVGAGPFRWLRDGTVAYVDVRRALVVRGRRVRLPAGALATLALAPDGERILYAKDCDVWLENLRSGTIRRLAHAEYSPERASWSPTGGRVALAAGWWADCDEDFDWYHAGTALFDGRGRELDRLPGHLVGWSADGRYLLTAGGMTGTEVAPLQPLVLDDLRTRAQSTLMPTRSTEQAFVLPGRRIVFGRIDSPAGVHEPEGLRPRLYAGRLVEAQR